MDKKNLKYVKRPSSVVYDADRLMKWLTKNDVKVLLHGHKHTTFHAHLNYPVIDDGGKFMVKGVAVIGLGSTACESTKNVAALLKITKNTVSVKVYELVSDESTDDKLSQEFTLPLGASIEWKKY